MVKKQKLMDLYKNKDYTQKEIASLYNVCQQTISRWFKKYDIKTNHKHTYEEVKKYFKDHGCQLLSKTYKDNKHKLKYKCECGEINKINFDSFKSGQRCYECRNKKISKALIHDYKYVKKYFKNHNCKLLSKEYKGYKEKLKFKCECGNISYITFDSFKNQDSRCSKCMPQRMSKSQRKSQKQFEKEVKDVHENKVEVIGKYETDSDKIKVKCNICSHEWKVQAGALIRGYGCPYCRKSKGEEKIQKWLDNNNYKYKREYRYDKCKNKRTLPFDFKVKLDNNFILIEYDGRQHHEAIDYFGGQQHLNYVKNNDRIKNNFCEKNGIQLLRISYKRKNDIENILANKL